MKHPFDIHVGSKIRQSRKNDGLESAELAEKLGISAFEMHAFEAGARRIDTDLLRKVTYVLDAPVTFYFEGLDSALDAA